MNRRKRVLRWIVWGVGGLLAVCIGLTGLSFLFNQNLPTQSSVIDQLSEADKARLAEYFQLRHAVGDDVWPGWADVDDAALLYNEAYAFLVGVSDPAVGWLTVPGHERRGEEWTLVENDTFMGQPYFRQPLPESGETPQAFTVQVGSTWVGSFQTREWMEIYFVEQLQSDLPPFLAAIFPYRLIRPLFIGGSDRYISLFAHESFHAYQGAVAEERLLVAETAVSTHQFQYPWQDVNLQAAWQTELDLLQQALRAETDSETAVLVQQFLTQRTTRRSNANLDIELVQYEQYREWVEELARYVELEIWRQAAAKSDYQPFPAVAGLPDFDAYSGFETRWKQEIDQITRMAGDDGDGRFYYTGMAQASTLR